MLKFTLFFVICAAFGAEWALTKAVLETTEEDSKGLLLLDECLKNLDEPKLCDPTKFLTEAELLELETSLKKIHEDALALYTTGTTEKKKYKKGFIVNFVLLPYPEDFSPFDNRVVVRFNEETIDETKWKHGPAAIVVLSVEKAEKEYLRTRFFTIASPYGPITNKMLVDFYHKSIPIHKKEKLADELKDFAEQISIAVKKRD